MRYQWRLIIDPPMSGSENMEKDILLMTEVASGESPPILRLYRWSPPAVSIGYFQDANDVVDLKACNASGVDVVRRPTGGRLVLHSDELTYSIIVPEAHPYIDNSGVVDAYRKISRGILTAFNLLGIVGSLAVDDLQKLGLSGGSCFDSPSAYEIQVENKKVVGSAQLRRDGILLQHGSVVFSMPLDLYAKVLKKDTSCSEKELRENLAKKAAGINDLGFNISFEKMTRALVKSFSMIIPAAFSSVGVKLKKMEE